VPRRRRTLSVTGLAVSAVAALALSSAVALAQTPPIDTSTDLLAPSPEYGTNPPAQPRRRGTGTVIAQGQAGQNQSGQDQLNQDQPPPTGMFSTTPSRIGATPVYGSPPAFGAGQTGYDSTNTGRYKKRAQTPPPTFPSQDVPDTTFEPVPTLTPLPPPTPPPPPPPVPADVRPVKAASRPGAVLPALPEALPVSNPPPEVHPLPAANRPGASTPVPQPIDINALNATAPAALPKVPALAPLPPTTLPPNMLPFNMVPQRPLPLAEGDPYAPLGLRAGSFVLLPSLDLSGNYSTNPLHSATTPSAAASFIGMPELQAISDWDRHSLTADIVGSYTEYGENLVPSLNVPYFSSTVDGRVDVSRDTQIVVENRYLLNTDNPGSPNLQAQLSRLPINTDLGGTLGVVHEFNRLSFALLGTYDTAQYDDSLLTNGQQVSNVSRNFNQTAGILRLSYDLDPGLKPFVQVEDDERTHPFDSQRNSTGTTIQAGGDVDLFGSLTGEMAAGWLVRDYDDPTMANISGFVANGSLIWQATPLTTAKLGAASEVYETTVAGASGQFTHDLNLEIDHAFVPWIVGVLQSGYGTDDYVGSSLRDSRYFVSAGLIYKMTREVQLRTQIRQDWQFATQPGFTFTATSALVGMHLQR
jgi:hypothetical protein